VAFLAALGLPLAGSSQPAPAEPPPGHRLMLRVLAAIAERTGEENPYLGDFRARGLRTELGALAADAPAVDRWRLLNRLGLAELYAGRFSAALARQQEAYELTARIKDRVNAGEVHRALFDLGMTHLRIGETQNCALQHSADSCILPIRGAGIHSDPASSRQAIRFFGELLESPSVDQDLAMQARWLLNLAYMTLGEHPAEVPSAYLIPPAVFASDVEFPEFEDIAGLLGIDTFGMSGGVVIDDFDNDLDLDLMVSDWHPRGQIRLWRNNADGTFSDVTETSMLVGIYGGLNLVHADYDNDGDVDVYVLRGAWLGPAGLHPNSLLRNNGDLTFTDVTFEAGLAADRSPTQTASWGDFDNDGDVDLYVASESTPQTPVPSLLYRNNGDGTFENVARQAGVENYRYTKGVVWGDFDGDRYPDLYLSNISGANRLYRNQRDGTFADVAEALGVEAPWSSFPTWFWDFDNDGALDLFVSSYPRSLAETARSYLGEPFEAELSRFYRGDGVGGFTDVSEKVGFRKIHDAMGANFGDLDGDGFPDLYLGTGFPPFEAISPNAMYLNHRGERFLDVTTAGRFGHLQKGHGIAFADLDHDGDAEVFAVMGGAVPGDEFNNSLWENPGFGSRWLTIKLVGTRSNRGAIGARIAVTFLEDGRRRTVFRHVASGGSFGANPLRQTIGLGRAERIEELEIYWPTSDTTQAFTGIELDSAIEIIEDQPSPRPLELPRFSLATGHSSPAREHRHPAPSPR
jgi:hypothetical protein